MVCNVKLTVIIYNMIKTFMYIVNVLHEVNKLGWEPLHLRRTKHKLHLIYKIVNGTAPDYLYEVIHPFFPVHHSHNLRPGFKKLCLPICKTVSYYIIVFPFYY